MAIASRYQPRIDIDELAELLESGMNQHQIAQIFGVSDAAISKRKKQLKQRMVKSVIRMDEADRVVRKNLDSIAQLEKINRYANELLDLLMAWQRGDETALRILEGQVRKVKVGRGKEAQEVTEYRMKDPRELALRAMAEIRNQLSCQLDHFKFLYDAIALKEFQEEVFRILEEFDPKIRGKIIRRLKERGALQAAFVWS